MSEALLEALNPGKKFDQAGAGNLRREHAAEGEGKGGVEAKGQAHRATCRGRQGRPDRERFLQRAANCLPSIRPASEATRSRRRVARSR